jgi:hypothetical protein
MRCSDAQFMLGADPSSADPNLLEHLRSCGGCAAHARDMQELDRRLRDAMAVPVPPPRRPASKPVTYLVPRLALAASVAGVAVLAGLLWIGVPRPTLAQAVVAHMAEEPAAWVTEAPLPDSAVAAVLSRSGVELGADLDKITYAHSCWFRGHNVPHLVVQTPGGPVTILVLRHESVAEAVEFQEGPYRGKLVPTRGGAIAVLARDATDVAAAAAQALAALRYVD